LDVVGPQINALIPGGANVEIAHQLGPHEFVVAVWERGVGRTLACGTGAAATVIEAVRQGRSPCDAPVVVHLPGGPLTITVQSDSFARLSGPAAYVYAGTTEL
jgi:diaminopimelate epimerase